MWLFKLQILMALDIHLLIFLVTKIGKATKQIHPRPKAYLLTQLHLIFKNFFFAEEVILIGVTTRDQKTK